MQEDRFRYILHELDEKGEVQVSLLAKKLNLTEMTVRSDLNNLAKNGMLKRIHGGAVKKGDYQYKDKTQDMVYYNSVSKMTIAKMAYELLAPGMTLYVDDSSTCLYLIKLIRKSPDMKCRVITNSIYVVMELLEAEHTSVYLLGGEVTKNLGSTSVEEEKTDVLNADFCFIGANGLSAKEGVSVMGYPQKRAKQIMMRNSKKKILLVDSQKFGKVFPTTIAELKDFDAIYTDGMIQSEDLQVALSDPEIHVIDSKQCRKI